MTAVAMPRPSYTVILMLILAGSFLSISQGSVLYSSQARARPLKAALIDEVALTNPDPYLVDNVTRTLQGVGYSVDYYGLKDVTVQLFKTLPSKGYGIIILRDHSAGLTGDAISLATGESFDAGTYQEEQSAGTIVQIQLNGTSYFGLTPTFVRLSMQGIFPNTVVVVMGCAGLANSEMAQAFVSKGAQVYVSWDQVVLVSQSDGGTILLIQSMITGQTVDEATAWATENAPSNPPYSPQMGYYPLDQGGITLHPGV